MKNIIILGTVIALAYYFLAAKSTTCNNLDEVEAKGIELTNKIQQVISEGNVGSIAVFSKHQSEMQRVLNQINNSQDGDFDYQATCDAIDNLLNDL